MSLSNLHVHLLEEIFTRLPVKYLIVLTSVCKSWLALISSRSFVESHLSHYHLNPDNHLLLLHHPFRKKFLISPINSFGNPHISKLPIPASDGLIGARNLSPFRQNYMDMTTTFVGSINGLVCYHIYRPPHIATKVVIWNPATHRFKDILLPHFNIKYPCRILVGFGFNCVVNDYKIVCIIESGFVFHNQSSYHFRMYSCNDNSWKELKPDFPLKLGFVECVTVKGNPYWACLYHDQPIDFWVRVDVETEGIPMFHGPEYVKNETTSTSIIALGDSVAQAVFSPGAEANEMVHVYALEENSGVWLRMYTIESIGVQRLHMPRVIFKCYRNGKLIFTGSQNKLFLYELASKELKELVVVEGKKNEYMPINYTESLVAIEGMERVGEEAAKEERKETALATTDRRVFKANRGRKRSREGKGQAKA